tara:strand:+ start:6991 stop:7275 length:285 start_codon:yes stop_codon:yes gene_type:complete
MDFLSVIKDAVIQPYLDTIATEEREEGLRRMNVERNTRHEAVQRGVDERLRRNAARERERNPSLNQTIQHSVYVTNMMRPRRDELQRQIDELTA